MDKFTVVSSTQHITVVTHAEGSFRPSSASCDFHPVDGVWWISRVIVEPSEARGRGVGSALLQRLIEEVKKYGGCLRVTPGGYAQDSGRQFRFYEKNGFVEVCDLDGRCMEYRTPPYGLLGASGSKKKMG